MLELPFLGRTLSLQVVLPSERKTPLSSLESQLTGRQVASWDVGLRRTKMDVFLPRSAITPGAFLSSGEWAEENLTSCVWWFQV